MKTSGNPTPNPQHIRDLATGIGQSQKMSCETGAARTAKVNATMPAKARAALPVNGKGGY